MTPNKHLDEMTLLLYVERQLDRERAQEVSLHTQTCTRCMTLLRALDRESRLLTRAMLEQDEPLSGAAGGIPRGREALHAVDLGPGVWSRGTRCLRPLRGLYRAMGKAVGPGWLWQHKPSQLTGFSGGLLERMAIHVHAV